MIVKLISLQQKISLKGKEHCNRISEMSMMKKFHEKEEALDKDCNCKTHCLIA